MKYYPISAINTRVHVVRMSDKKTLCGITPDINWEMQFEGQVFPEIESFVEKSHLTNGSGFYIGRWFAPEDHFCRKCFCALKKEFDYRIRE